MFENNYDLNADPFRLTPDPRFLYAHPSYLKTHESMRHSFASGEGIFVLTGRPGIGKSTLIQGFLGEFDQQEVLCATLSSTNVDGEDLLRMVAYSFGLEARGLDKATLLHELHNLLQTHSRALLVIDEAHNLCGSALEEVRTLANLQAGSRPLLQIFLVGQNQLHDQLHSPEMEQLHQQLMVSCTLEPLNLRETRDYILHRLNCIGSLEYPEISPVVFVLVHRYAQGLPRYINQLCTQLLLHGAIEKRQRLDLDDVVSSRMDFDVTGHYSRDDIFELKVKDQPEIKSS